MSTERETMSPVRWVLMAVAVWGVVLALGATGVYAYLQAPAGQTEGLIDWRRGAIVLFCTAAFLGFWTVILRQSRRSSQSGTPEGTPAELSSAASPSSSVQPAGPVQPASSAQPASAERLPVSRAAWVSLGAMLISGLLWAVAVSRWDVQRSVAVSTGWLSFASWAVALVAAMVALSDPRRLRGKWLAGLVLLAAAVTLGIFWVRW